MTAAEIWKPVNSLNGLLEASSLGRIRRLPRPLIYKDGRRGELKGGVVRGTFGGNGYVVISFGKRKILAHRLVAEAFHGIPDDAAVYKSVNHLNGDKHDNRPENLEWVTFKQNNDHARETGLSRQHGEHTNLSKYTDQFIEAVRNVHAEYSPNWEKLGKMFGITGCHARQIVLKLTRKRATQ